MMQGDCTILSIWSRDPRCAAKVGVGLPRGESAGVQQAEWSWSCQIVAKGIIQEVGLGLTDMEIWVPRAL